MVDSSTRCLTLSTIFLVIFTQCTFYRSIILEQDDSKRLLSVAPALLSNLTSDDAAYLAHPITTSELRASILLLSETRLATSDMGNAIERIGQLNLKVRAQPYQPQPYTAVIRPLVRTSTNHMVYVHGTRLHYVHGTPPPALSPLSRFLTSSLTLPPHPPPPVGTPISNAPP